MKKHPGPSSNIQHACRELEEALKKFDLEELKPDSQGEQAKTLKAKRELIEKIKEQLERLES